MSQTVPGMNRLRVGTFNLWVVVIPRGGEQT